MSDIYAGAGLFIHFKNEVVSGGSAELRIPEWQNYQTEWVSDTQHTDTKDNVTTILFKIGYRRQIVEHRRISTHNFF